MGTKKRYSREFKQGAVDLVIKQGLPLRQAASDLGVGKSTLDKWVREGRQRAADPNSLSENELEELKRLRKECRILKMERDLLKKTAVYFAKTAEEGMPS